MLPMDSAHACPSLGLASTRLLISYGSQSAMAPNPLCYGFEWGNSFPGPLIGILIQTERVQLGTLILLLTKLEISIATPTDQIRTLG